MTLLITSEEAEQVMPMRACLDALEQSFRELAAGIAVNRPRSDTYTPTSEKDVYYRYKTMEGAVPQVDDLSSEPPSATNGAGPTTLSASYEGQAEDEEDTERDLSYEFSMPNPLKRQMADLINSIANIARTFDPNNTNLELSRTLLGVALGQGLELADPAAAVERILPEGYVDPMLAAQMGGGGVPGGPPPGQPPLLPTEPGSNPFGPGGPPPGEGPDGEANAYGAQGQSTAYRAGQGQLGEASYDERMAELLDVWDEELGEIVDEMFAAASSNGAS